MLLNSAYLKSFAGPPARRISAPDPDPFQALYDSLSNLTLTPGSVSGPSQPAPAQPATVQGINANDIPINHAQISCPVTDLSPIPASILFPPGDNVIFAHSSYFVSPSSRGTDLPTPSHIRADLITRAFTSGHFPTSLPLPAQETPQLIPYPSVNLLVKYGHESQVTSTEAKTILLVGRLLENAVPVPEVFGWRRDVEAKERVIYMSLPAGQTLASRWDSLTTFEKDSICLQLRAYVRQWRRLSQPPGRSIVGGIDSTPLNDDIFQFVQSQTTNSGLTIPPAGPFPNVSNFHSYFVATAVALSQNKHGNGTQEINYQPHHLFPNNVPLAFTHGALHPRNVVISEGPNPKIEAIIGWEQAGWYPAYWELCKARLECSRNGGGIGGEWETKYLPGILNVDGYGVESEGWNGRALLQYWDYFVGLMQ